MSLRNFYRFVLFGMTSLLIIGAIEYGQWLLSGLFLVYGYVVYRAFGITTEDK